MREHAPSTALVFNHIPKCAGTSLRISLQQAVQPERQEHRSDLSLVGGYADFDRLSPAARASFAFGPEDLDASATFVTGHISPGTTMARYPDAAHVTTLRHPGLRIVSQWMHSRALSDFDLRHWGPGAAAFRAGRASFRDYLNHAMVAPNVDNTITRFLTWPHPLLQPSRFIEEDHDDDLLAAALDRLEGFGHVGVIENLAFQADLGTFLGRTLHETRLNERQSIPRGRRPDLDTEMSADTLDLLAHRTRLDRQVWLHVAAATLADPSQVLQTAWDTSMARYASASHEAGDRRPIKRVVEVLYEQQQRLRGRTRA